MTKCCLRVGRCNAVALWVEARFCWEGQDAASAVQLPSNGPGSRCKRQLLCHLMEAVELEEGAACRLSVSFDSASGVFTVSCFTLGENFSEGRRARGENEISEGTVSSLF